MGKSPEFGSERVVVGKVVRPGGVSSTAGPSRLADLWLTLLEPASPPEKGETTVKQRKASTEAVRRATDLQIQNPDAAGIDLGSREHFVAVPEDRDTQPVKGFGCYTQDLHLLARWLKDCAITTVAMESTGVYWVPVYEILEQYGFEVHLVDARQLKNVSGRKSDVQDCQWIQRLHSYGLLS